MLGSLTCDHPDNEKKVCDKDGINLIIDCIKKFPDNTDIQIFGLRLLGNLTYDHPDNNKKVCDKDGINLVFDCIKKFPDNTCIQIFGLHFLMILVYYKSYNKDLVCDNIKKISNKDGIQLVLNTMKKFSDNQIIQRYGIFLLVILACNNYSDNKKKIAVKNNIELISNAMKKYPDNQYIQENAKKLLDVFQNNTNKRDREEDSTEPNNSQKVRKLENSNYITEDGVVLVPSMKALYETQTAVKVKVEKEEEVAQEDAKSYALFIDKQQSEIDRLKELCKKNKIDV